MKVNCPPCRATGLYKGFAEPEGTAVICHSCNGKGSKEVNAGTIGGTPFTGRKPNPGIQRVMTDGGLWMTRGTNPSTISIQEFYEKVPE